MALESPGDELLWPARNVAEYAYCPRLFYLMQVEGIFLPNSDTVEGRQIHRRVDRPSAMKSPAKKRGATNGALTGNADEAVAEGDESRPQSVRSLVLTSVRHGLTATLDLAEISGMRAIPVEYRHGGPCRGNAESDSDSTAISETDADSVEAVSSPIRPWPTDRVQIGLQAILLEESGYMVHEAIFYYAKERRRLTIPVDAELRQEAMATLDAARRCAEGVRPLPLVRDPRCVRCSLQPFCLPDEILYQRSTEPETLDNASSEAAPPGGGTTISPRRIWPPLDEGLHIVVQQTGVKIGVRGQELRVIDRDGSQVKATPLATLESLAILGSIQLSTQAIHALAEQSVPVAFLSSAGRLIAMIDPCDSVSAELRRRQIRTLDQSFRCLELSRALISAKISNQRTLLMRNHPLLPGNVSRDLQHLSRQATESTDLDSLRGTEGRAAAIYFRYFGGALKSESADEFERNGRMRRPPPDPVNAALSLAYTMLTHECVSALRQARLEPSIGGFHVSRPGRPAFALDLMEPFRPLISDSVVLSCFNRGELTDGHFMRTAAGCVLTDAGRRAFFMALGRRMDTEITHPVFGYRLSYRRMIVLHARMIAAWCMGEVQTLSFLTTR